MPAERFPLLASMVLQGVVALTFALAFLGLWRGFRREASRRFGIAFLLYAVGVWLSFLGIAFAVTRNWPVPLRGFVGLPLQIGPYMFRPAMESLLGSGTPFASRRNVVVLLLLLLVFIPVQSAVTLWAPEFRPYTFPYVVPRFLLGVGFLWAGIPAFSRRVSDLGPRLVGAILLLIAVRMFGSVAYELAQIAQGNPQQPESAALSILQVGLMILLGVAATTTITDLERRRALADANTIRDTSAALRQSEARFRFVAEHSSDLQVIVGRDARLRYVASNSQALLGMASGLLEGRDLLSLVHDSDREALRHTLASADDSGMLEPVAFRLHHGKGEWRQFEARGQRVSGSRVEGTDHEDVVVLSLRDVTDQRRMEALLVRAQKMESIGRMAGSIAHDYNNMLTAIRGGLGLLRYEIPAGSHLLPLVQEVDQAAEAGSALVRQLLSFARRNDERPLPFDIGDRLRGMSTMLGRAAGKGVALNLVIDEEPLMVRADASQFDQVMVNLTLNARDAMPEGGEITIRVRGDGEEHLPQVVLEIEDTGVGIPVDMLDQVFEPFFTTKGHGAGTGLGLAAAFDFARHYGGSLAVRSSVGKGSVFAMRLPALRESATTAR